MRIRSGLVAIAVIAPACSHREPPKPAPPADAAPARSTEIEIGETYQGDDPSDNNPVTERYLLSGTHLQWQWEDGGGEGSGKDGQMVRFGGTPHVGDVTLTAAQLASLEDLVRSRGLLDGGSASHPDDDSPPFRLHDVFDVAITVDGRTAHARYENGSSADPGYDATQALFAAMRAIAPRR